MILSGPLSLLVDRTEGCTDARNAHFPLAADCWETDGCWPQVMKAKLLQILTPCSQARGFHSLLVFSLRLYLPSLCGVKSCQVQLDGEGMRLEGLGRRAPLGPGLFLGTRPDKHLTTEPPLQSCPLPSAAAGQSRFSVLRPFIKLIGHRIGHDETMRCSQWGLCKLIQNVCRWGWRHGSVNERSKPSIHLTQMHRQMHTHKVVCM